MFCMLATAKRMCVCVCVCVRVCKEGGWGVQIGCCASASVC